MEKRRNFQYKKYILAVMLCLSILVVSLPPMVISGTAQAASGSGISMEFVIGQNTYTINGVTTTMDVSPMVIEDRTMLPIRFVAEPLGAAVRWDPGTEKVTVQLMDTIIELWIGQSNALVSGVSTPIDPDNPNVRPLTENDRTMLPVRFVAENLGCDVKWIEETQQVIVANVSSGGSSTTPGSDLTGATVASGEEEAARGEGEEPGASLDGIEMEDGTGEGIAPEIPSEIDQSIYSELIANLKLMPVMENAITINNKFTASDSIMSIANTNTGILALNPDAINQIRNSNDTGSNDTGSPDSSDINNSYGKSTTDEVLTLANKNDPGVRYLGTGYDMSRGDYAITSGFASKPMLNIDKLLEEGQVMRRYLNESTMNFNQGQTAISYSQSRAGSYGVSGSYYFLSGGVSSSFSESFIGEYGRSFATITHMSHQYYLYINPELINFSRYLSDSYKQAATDAASNNNSWTYERLVKEYGTHMVRSLYTGGWVDYNMTAYNSSTLTKSYNESQVKGAFDYGLFSLGGSSSSSNEIIEGIQNSRITAAIRAVPSYPGLTSNETTFNIWDAEMKSNPVICDFDKESLVLAGTLVANSGIEVRTLRRIPGAANPPISTNAYLNAYYRYLLDNMYTQPVTVCLNGLALYETTWNKVNATPNSIVDGNDKWQKIGPVGGKPEYIGADSGSFLSKSPAYVLYARFGLSNDLQRPPITDIYVTNYSRDVGFQYANRRFNLKYGEDNPNAEIYSVPLWAKRNSPAGVNSPPDNPTWVVPESQSGTDFNRGVRLGSTNYRFGNNIRISYVTCTDRTTPPIKRLRTVFYEKADHTGAAYYSPAVYSGQLEEFYTASISTSDPMGQDTAEGYKDNQFIGVLTALQVKGERYLEYSYIGD